MTTFGVFSHKAKILMEKPEKMNVKKLTITYLRIHEIIQANSCRIEYILLATSKLIAIQVIINFGRIVLWTIG